MSNASELFRDVGSHVFDVLGLLVFRAFPFLIYGLISRQVPLRGKGFAVSLFLTVLLFLHLRHQTPLTAVSYTALVFVYFTVCGVFCRAISPVQRRLPLNRGFAFGLFAGLFVLVPALLFRLSPIEPAAIVVGWELMLSAYSVYADTRHSHRSVSIRDYLFFLLINPTVVFSNSGCLAGPPRWKTEALLRILFGAVLVFLRSLIPMVLALLAFEHVQASSGLHEKDIVDLSVLGIGLYFAHSGLAHVQIGFMSLIGYEIPERYEYPFLATSPQDFWRRWNVWIGDWARHYLYFPIARALSRRLGRHVALSGNIAIVAVFAVVGLLHDFGIEALRFATSLSFAMTRAFILFGVAYVSWPFVAKLFYPRDASRMVRHNGSRILFVPVLLCMAWIALPALMGSRTPRSPTETRPQLNSH